ncbi:putative DBINO protein [Hordeum vulgare]|nr:putative DBINO protein [Hordeum vulgare]
MADPLPNSGDPAVVPATKAKTKKAPKGTKKSRSELTPEEIAKLDAELAKRRNRQAKAKRKAAAAAYAIEHAVLEAARQKVDAQEKEATVSKAHALLVMGLCRLTSFVVAPVGLASTRSSVIQPPQCPSPTSSTMLLSPSFPPPSNHGPRLEKLRAELEIESGDHKDGVAEVQQDLQDARAKNEALEQKFEEQATELSKLSSKKKCTRPRRLWMLMKACRMAKPAMKDLYIRL